MTGLAKHLGPGPHPGTGTPQSIHGGDRVGAQPLSPDLPDWAYDLGDEVAGFLEEISDDPPLAFESTMAVRWHEYAPMVLEHGEVFLPEGGVTWPEEMEDLYGLGTPRECFKNAFKMVLAEPDQFMYCEGVAVPSDFPGERLPHAWVVERSTGRLYDPTWCGRDRVPYGNGAVPMPTGILYFGIPFDNDWLFANAARTGYYGVFSGIKVEVPGEAVDREWMKRVAKHYGPGRHPGTGSTQEEAHGHGEGGAEGSGLPHGGTLEAPHHGAVPVEALTAQAGENRDRFDGIPMGMSGFDETEAAGILDRLDDVGGSVEQIATNLDEVFGSALERYAAMDADRSVHTWEEIPPWFGVDRNKDGLLTPVYGPKAKGSKDEFSGPEIDPVYLDLIEVVAPTVDAPDGGWRWVEDAGHRLRVLDLFYQQWHEDLLVLSDTYSPNFATSAAIAAGLSPGMEGNTANLEMAALTVRTLDEDPAISGEVNVIVNAVLRAKYLDEKKKAEALQDDTKAKAANKADRLAQAEVYNRTVTEGERLSALPDELVPYAMHWYLKRQDRIANPMIPPVDEKSYPEVQALVAEHGEDYTTGRGLKVPTGFGAYVTAVSLYRSDGSMGAIDGILVGSSGWAKVRSFFNNIVDPDDEYGRGDLTIDFRMMDAALHREGSRNTSLQDSPSIDGVGFGIRPVVAEGIRTVHAERGHEIAWRDRPVSPLEVQEVLWAEWRRGTEEIRKGTKGAPGWTLLDPWTKGKDGTFSTALAAADRRKGRSKKSKKGQS